MRKIQIVALHGFLGSGQDWDSLEQCLDPNIKNHLNNKLSFLKINLFSKNESQITSEDLVSFKNLSRKIHQLTDPESIKIFLGYSLGGRIGLHLLEQFGHEYSQFIFMSTHPGLTSTKEKSLRETNDLQWLMRLQNLNFDDFLKEWGQQPVFKNDLNLTKNESDFDLKKLEFALRELSLAQQENKEAVLKQHSSKVKWLVGDHDSKFVDIAEQLKQKKILSGYERILNSGHRIVFDNSQSVSAIIEEIILQLQS